MNTILLLAADPGVHQGFKLQFEKFNLQLHSAYGLAEAKVHLEAAPPSLLLVDLDEMSEAFVPFYHWVVDQPNLRGWPRLFISGRESRDSEIVRLLQVNPAEPLLNKPLQRVQFLRAVKDLLKRQTQSFGGALVQSLPTPNTPTNPAAPVPHSHEQTTNKWLGRQVGSVMLQREIGRGGMGAVFLGFQSTLNRKVAVKMILPELINNATMMARFQREALAMAKLKSSHIVQVYDAGYTDDGTFFMVMEFLEGQDLEVTLRQQGPFDADTVMEILEQVLEGLIVAHDSGIIHRDLKPSNLIRSESGHTTVTDFGLAQQLTDLNITREGTMLGTPYYFAPEQANGKGSDARSDIYSLGIVLFELLVGEVPFPSSQLTEVLYQHAHKPMPDPRKRVGGVPREVVDVLERMTAKLPDHRFPDARTTLEAIRHARKACALPVEHLTTARDTLKPIAQPLSLSHLPIAPPAPARALSSSLQTSHGGLSLPIDPEKRIGAFQLNSSGSLTSQDGHFSPVWGGALQTLQAVLQQLEAVADMGPLNYALCEAERELLVLVTEAQHTQGMIFSHDVVPSSLRMSLSQNGGGASLSTSIVDPLVHLSSTVGVNGLMLLTEEGVLRHHALPSYINVNIFASHIAPLTALFSSLSLPLSGVDCCFERGRTLLWKIERQYLVVLASEQLNKALLRILIEQQRELLRTFVPRSGAGAGLSLVGPAPHTMQRNQHSLQVSSSDTDAVLIDDGTFSSPDPHTAAVASLAQSLGASLVPGEPIVGVTYMSKEEMAKITKEFARFIGPMAKVLLKKEAKRLGFSTKQFPADKVPALIKKLGGKLDSDKRQDFLEIANNMLD